jgi:CheY-like chemotaxis protein
MKKLSGSAVQRHLIFVLGDGQAVVQWDDNHVQELLSGRYRTFTQADFGHPITDYELNQLKAAGRVEQFNRIYVWLFALPEQNRFTPALRVQERSLDSDRVRAYYLNTTLPVNQMERVEAVLRSVGLGDELKVSNRNDSIAILNKHAAPFPSLKDAENAQRQLRNKAPDEFKHTVIAFVEVPGKNGTYNGAKLQTSELLDLDTIIASQTDTTLTQGKHVVLAATSEPEGQPVMTLLTQMKFDARLATSAQSAISLLEDFDPSLLIADVQLPDMHVWEMLAKLREISSLHHVMKVVLANEGMTVDEQSIGLSVARVDAYLVRPLSMARLRQSIWMAFKQRATEET